MKSTRRASIPTAAESARQITHTLVLRARELIARGEIRQAERFIAAAEKLDPDSQALAETRRLLDVAKAKIELAMKRAELKKAQKAGADQAQLDSLQDALNAAEQALHDVEAQRGEPTARQRVMPSGVDDAYKACKTELAFARADLRKLERDPASSEDALAQARQRLASAEQRLAELPQH